MFGNARARLVLVSALTLLAAACGGDDEGGTPDATSGTSQATSTATAASTASSGAAKTATASGGGSTADFAGLFAQSRSKPSRIEYDIDGQGTMTMYTSGERMRMDIDDPSEGKMTMIVLPDRVYTCLAEQQTCLEIGGAAAGAGENPFAAAVDELVDNAAGYTVRELDRRRVAGLEARCFEYSGGEGERGTSCLGPEGQLLLVEGQSAGTTYRMEATSVSGNVSSGDFEPPYPTMAMPSFGR